VEADDLQNLISFSLYTGISLV